MGIFKKIVKTASGGDQVCKYCGEKKTLISSYACKAGKKHKWVKA